MANDPIMDEIFAATAVFRGGDRSGGRSQLEAIWARIADDPAPVHVMALSHALADAQDDPAEELAWDLRALDAALLCTDADVQRTSQATSIAVFMPSLYVNLAEDYFKLGDFGRSKDHLASARACVGVLADDDYGKLIRGGIARLAKQLDARGNSTPR